MKNVVLVYIPAVLLTTTILLTLLAVNRPWQTAACSAIPAMEERQDNETFQPWPSQTVYEVAI